MELSFRLFRSLVSDLVVKNWLYMEKVPGSNVRHLQLKDLAGVEKDFCLPDSDPGEPLAE